MEDPNRRRGMPPGETFDDGLSTRRSAPHLPHPIPHVTGRDEGARSHPYRTSRDTLRGGNGGIMAWAERAGMKMGWGNPQEIDK